MNSSSKFESKYSTLPSKPSKPKNTEYEKSADFGTFSLLNTPKLLTGITNMCDLKLYLPVKHLYLQYLNSFLNIILNICLTHAGGGGSKNAGYLVPYII